MATYPARQVKILNERLRKLESVYIDKYTGGPLAGSSYFYQMAKAAALENQGGRGKFYQPTKLTRNEDGSWNAPKIRFLNKTQFSNLSQQEQKAFIQQIRSALSSETSTKSGYEASAKRARQNIIDYHGEYFKDIKERASLSEDEKEELMHERAAELQQGISEYFANNKDHLAYNKDIWSVMSYDFDFTKFFIDNRKDPNVKDWENIFTRAYNLVNSYQAEKVPMKYRMTNY